MPDSKLSAEEQAAVPPPARRARFNAADVVIALGILLVVGGAAMLHLGAGVATLGVALVLIGARGLPAGS
jgi:hypothetical protein